MCVIKSSYRRLFIAIVFVACCLRAVSAGQAAFEPDDNWVEFQARASEQYGDFGAMAAKFLGVNRPSRDADLDPELLLENLDFAVQARQAFVWAQAVPDEMFLNDVLPYAVLDETRERWRAVLFPLAHDIVKNLSSPEEAAQALNRDLFAKINVRYSTARQKANQGVLESMKSGLASCTGLSILLVNACRSVGIPSRIAGIAHWPERGGNHTWVEIWDGQRWRYAGAAEFDSNGLDRAWFTGQASSAIEGHERHGIWATSFKPTGHHFPLAWNAADRSVAALDVTQRYAPAVASSDKANERTLAVRLWESRGGVRLASQVKLISGTSNHTAMTFADPDDINRVAEFPWSDAAPARLEFKTNDQTRIAWPRHDDSRNGVHDYYWDELSLSRESAEGAAQAGWQSHVAAQREERTVELDSMALRDGEFTMRLLRRDFGDRPASGHSLWISMHGGGNAPAEVNERQWQNQINLYSPEEGIYLAPRAPTDTWNLWHRPEIDRLFDRLIDSAIMVWGIDPDRVYLMGYSAGGDGVYQLAPRMADRFAAASMMAGHPNDASPLSLRNLPFAIFVGENDSAYNRNTVATDWARQLDALHANDPDGYVHRINVYPGMGHWMQGQDAVAIPWMAQMVRNAWPKRVLWRQGNVNRARFYWLAVSDNNAASGRVITAQINRQTIEITSDYRGEIELLLRDELIELDEPIRVIANGHVVHNNRIARMQSAITRSLELRSDPRQIATARLVVKVPAPEVQNRTN